MTGLEAALAGLPADLRAEALTHPSWVEDRARSYERLEFLGDAILGAAVAEELLGAFPTAPEGFLAQRKAFVISRVSCAAVARASGLDEVVRVEADRLGLDGALLADTDSVLAAVCEAIVGAVFLSAGYGAAHDLVRAAFADRFALADARPVDAKTALQEAVQQRGGRVAYDVVGTSGPPHARLFEVAVSVNGDVIGAGVGRSKKAAEQVAAEQALERLDA